MVLNALYFLKMIVSVPIRGLFNLTADRAYISSEAQENEVSVPIRGLFNLTI